MNYTGILTPNGNFIRCESYEHLWLAEEIAEKLGYEYSFKGGVECENYLQKLGYIIVQARYVYGLVGHLNDGGEVIRLSDEQKKWLEDHYDEFPKAKQRSIDKLIDHDSW